MTERIAIMRYLFVFSLLALFLIPPVQAQQHRLTGELAVGKIGAGDHLIPSAQLGYSREIWSYVDVTASTRFSFIETYGSRFLLSRGSFSYLDGAVGLTIRPFDTDHHRLDVGLSGAIRGRWETRATRAKARTDSNGEIEEIIFIDYERRKSADVGYLLRAGYSYRISSSVRLGAHLHGYTYQEGTSLFVFGLSVDYTL
jgi:hypothetical protein